MESVQHRGVLCQNHLVPESDVLPFLTPMEATLNIQEIDPLVPLAPGFHCILTIIEEELVIHFNISLSTNQIYNSY